VLLRAYEVSYCDLANACGPGFFLGDEVNGSTRRRDGIRPYLHIVFQPESWADRRFPFDKLTLSLAGTLLVPYNAEAWMASRFGGLPPCASRRAPGG
jgi:hypothetical protein